MDSGRRLVLEHCSGHQETEKQAWYFGTVVAFVGSGAACICVVLSDTDILVLDLWLRVFAGLIIRDSSVCSCLRQSSK